jgi:hypothetical protein
MSNVLKTKHNLNFESAFHPFYGDVFRVGTCHGIWGSAEDCYYILSVMNDKAGNGHLDDVFEWFEASCKRDKKNLIVLACFNKRFYNHLIHKRNFIELDKDKENCIKIFNDNLYQILLNNGNEILHPKTLKCY